MGCTQYTSFYLHVYLNIGYKHKESTLISDGSRRQAPSTQKEGRERKEKKPNTHSIKIKQGPFLYMVLLYEVEPVGMKYSTVKQRKFENVLYTLWMSPPPLPLIKIFWIRNW